MRDPLVKGVASSLGIAAAFALCSPVEAAVLELGASNQAWYREDGAQNFSQNLPINNTFTGFGSSPGCDRDDCEHRSYFSFDLASVTKPVKTAKLQLYVLQAYSSAIEESFTLYEVDTPVQELAQLNWREDGMQIFDDLGDGKIYGQGTVSRTPPGSFQETFVGTTIEVSLSEDAIAAINRALSLGKNSQGKVDFTVGAALASFNNTPYKFSDGRGFEALTFSDPTLRDRLPSTITIPPDVKLAEPARLIVEEMASEPPENIPEPSAAGGTLAAFGLGFTLLQQKKRQSNREG